MTHSFLDFFDFFFFWGGGGGGGGRRDIAIVLHAFRSLEQVINLPRVMRGLNISYFFQCSIIFYWIYRYSVDFKMFQNPSLEKVITRYIKNQTIRSFHF